MFYPQHAVDCLRSHKRWSCDLQFYILITILYINLNILFLLFPSFLSCSFPFLSSFLPFPVFPFSVSDLDKVTFFLTFFYCLILKVAYYWKVSNLGKKQTHRVQNTCDFYVDRLPSISEIFNYEKHNSVHYNTTTINKTTQNVLQLFVCFHFNLIYPDIMFSPQCTVQIFPSQLYLPVCTVLTLPLPFQAKSVMGCFNMLQILSHLSFILCQKFL